MRAICLQKALQHWFHTKEDVCITSLALHNQEWQQMHYIVQLIKPFALHGYIIGVRESPTIQHVFLTYNELFGHLDNKRAWLRRKRKAWKRDFFPAIDAAREKLCTYYDATEGRQGRFYNLGTVLNPTCKLTLYNERDWEQKYALMNKRNFFEHF